MIVEKGNNLDCYDLARTCKSFQTKVYGVKVAIHNKQQKMSIILCGITDDIMLQCIDSQYINTKLKTLENNTRPDLDKDSFKHFTTASISFWP